jgi:DNA-binding helix-hairpin-helix protein with protein kinase domain
MLITDKELKKWENKLNDIIKTNDDFEVFSTLQDKYAQFYEQIIEKNQLREFDKIRKSIMNALMIGQIKEFLLMKEISESIKSAIASNMH